MTPEKDAEKVKNPVLGREDIAPQAREPLDQAPGAGFGSHYEGPQVQTAEEPLLGAVDMEPDAGSSTGLEPDRLDLPDEPDPWGSHEARDFRREES